MPLSRQSISVMVGPLSQGIYHLNSECSCARLLSKLAVDLYLTRWRGVVAVPLKGDLYGIGIVSVGNV